MKKCVIFCIKYLPEETNGTAVVKDVNQLGWEMVLTAKKCVNKNMRINFLTNFRNDSVGLADQASLDHLNLAEVIAALPHLQVILYICLQYVKIRYSVNL